MDRVLALHAGSRGFDSHRGHVSERFFRSNRPGYPQPVSSLSWKIVVSEWRSVIAVSLNVGGGVRLINPAKLYTCTQKHYKTQRGRTHGAGCERQCSVPLSHSGNVVARIFFIHTYIHIFSAILSLELIMSTPPVSQKNYHIW